MRWAGSAFLLWYGLLAARRALRPRALSRQADRHSTSRGAAISTAVALTWLNPGVYLDTVVLLGSVAHTRSQPWWFGAGAALGSLLWFFALGYGARLLSGQLDRPRAWQVLDGFVAVVMVTTAVRVLAG